MMGAVFVFSEARGNFLREASDLDSPVFCWVNIGIVQFGFYSHTVHSFKTGELAFELNISFELSSLWQSVSEFSGSGEGSPFEDIAFKI